MRMLPTTFFINEFQTSPSRHSPRGMITQQLSTGISKIDYRTSDLAAYCIFTVVCLYTCVHRHRVVEHYLIRCQGNHQLLESFNLIGRTSEFSRLYGIEFENVVNRGSQYRVESMMLRLAKPANFVAVSPSVQQRAR